MAFGSAPFPSSIQFVLPQLATAYRRTVAPSSTCLMLPNCPRLPMRFAVSMSILVTVRPLDVRWCGERGANGLDTPH